MGLSPRAEAEERTPLKLRPETAITQVEALLQGALLVPQEVPLMMTMIRGEDVDAPNIRAGLDSANHFRTA